ncbi:MAG: hypothetical protein ACO1RA_08460 [Planctomycetaceae bacterium]
MWFFGRKKEKGLSLRWNQIRLRHLLVAMLVISVAFWVVRQRIESSERKKAVQKLEKFSSQFYHSGSRNRFIKAILGDDGEAGTVRQIVFYGMIGKSNELMHPIPFRYFPELKLLKLRQQYQGEILLHIDDAKNLSELELEFYSLNSKEVEAISRLKRLESLSLTSCINEDSCVSQLKGLTSLKRIELRYLNGLTVSDLKVCESCRDLESIAVVRTKFSGSGVLDWSSLKSLHSVSFERCEVSDEIMEAIATTPNLQSLNLDSCIYNAEKLLGLLTKCKSLKSLRLYQAKPFADPIWESIAQLDQLEDLTLFESKMDPHALQVLSSAKSLRKLTLIDVAAIDPAILSQFHQLSELQLYGTPFDSAFVGQLKNLPSLRRFHLGANNLRLDDVRLLLRTLPQITYVDLFPQEHISEKMVQTLREEFPQVKFAKSESWSGPTIY